MIGCCSSCGDSFSYVFLGVSYWGCPVGFLVWCWIEWRDAVQSGEIFSPLISLGSLRRRWGESVKLASVSLVGAVGELLGVIPSVSSKQWFPGSGELFLGTR